MTPLSPGRRVQGLLVAAALVGAAGFAPPPPPPPPSPAAIVCLPGGAIGSWKAPACPKAAAALNRRAGIAGGPAALGCGANGSAAFVGPASAAGDARAAAALGRLIGKPGAFAVAPGAGGLRPAPTSAGNKIACANLAGALDEAAWDCCGVEPWR